jgi:Na+/glutamate symporter
MEKARVGSKSARAAGIAGIIFTGVIGGSFIVANYISKKFINPLLNENKNKQEADKEIIQRDTLRHWIWGYTLMMLLQLLLCQV